MRPYSLLMTLVVVAIFTSYLPACATAQAPSPCSATYGDMGSFQAAARSTANSGKVLCATGGVSGDLDLGGVHQPAQTTLRPADGQSISISSLDASNTSNIRLQGLNVTDGIAGDGSQNLVVQDNTIAAPGSYGVSALNRPWGLQVIGNRFGMADFDVRLNWNDYWTGTQPSGVVIAGNDFPGDLANGYQITSIELGGNPIGVKYLGNTCHDNEETGQHQDCIQLVGATNTLIQGNIFRNVSSAVMLPGHDGPNAPTNIVDNLYDNANYICDCGEMGNSLVAGNTFIAGDATGGGMLLSDDSDDPTDTAPSRITMIDNIFVLGHHWLVGGNLLGAQVNQDYNVAPGNTEGPHDIGAQPKFVNAGAHDYRLAPGSPGIDAGTSTGAPACDIAGMARVDDRSTPNSGGGAVPYYDIGAYEFGSTKQCSGAPVAPTARPAAHLKVRLLTPHKRQVFKGRIVFRAKVSGPSRIRWVRFYVGKRVVRVDKKRPFRRAWKVRHLSFGWHTVTVRVKDVKGRTARARVRVRRVRHMPGSHLR